MVEDSPYTMQIEISTLRHLGIGLYSNISAVLAEAVANAWDADATCVSILTDSQKSTMTITDDGQGMSVEDVNKKYLRVGYERRERGEGRTRRFNRRVMGRKGIGKLSLFSIADTVTIHTVKDGQSHGFRMNINDMKNAFESSQPAYKPQSIGPDPGLKQGTKITLVGTKHQIYTKSARKKLARRFIIDSDEFKIMFDGKPITLGDRDYHKNLQYVWTFGERGEKSLCESQAQRQRLSPEVVVGDRTYGIDGWIGAVKSLHQLKDADTKETMNKIAIMVRNKMAQDDVLGAFEEGGIYIKYLVGEIYADFLDEDGGDDIMTTGRQLIKEDDPRYAALKEKIWRDLKIIQNKWTDLRNDEGVKDALDIPQIGQWYEGLSSDYRNTAKKLFGRINRLQIDDDSTKKEMLVGGILAFENLRLKDMLGKLDKIDVTNLPELKDVFLQLDDLEATAYYQTINKRLEVINTFVRAVDDNTKERIIQEYIFDHLWVLDPSWERIAGTERMETSMARALDTVSENIPEEHRRDRVDIKYRATSGKHVIIELKRPGAVTSAFTIGRQISKYRDAALGVLANLGKGHEIVEFVCVLGKPPQEWEDRDGEEKARTMLAAYGARIVMYDELVENAQKAYEEYLTKEKNITKVFRLIQSITEGGPQNGG